MSQLEHNIAKMKAIRLLYWTHFMASVLIPFFRDWGGISFTQIFTLNAWFMFWNFLLEVPTGTVADVVGRKFSLALGGLVGAVGWLVYTSVADFRIFLIGEVFVATSMTLMSGADDALVYDTLEILGRTAESKRIFGQLESWKLAGIIYGATAGGFIAASLGVRATMMMQTIPSLFVVGIALSLVEPKAAAGGQSLADYWRTLRSGMAYFRHHPTLRALTADMVGASALAWLIIWLYQPQLERGGIGIRWFGLVHAAMCLGQILLLTNIERVEHLIGSRARYLFLSAVVPGVCYLAMAATDRAPFLIAAIVLSAAFGMSRPPLFLAAMNQHIPAAQRATILSTISMVRTLAVAVVNPIAGWLLDQSMRGALITFGIVALLFAITARAAEEHVEA